MKRIIIFLLFLLLVFLTLFPRSVEVLNRNYVFGFDQGRDYLAVKNIVINHKFTLIGSEIGAGVAGFRGIFHGPFYYYSLSIPFIILGGDPYGGIILMFLFGLSSVFLGFYLGKKLFGKIGGLTTALLVAMSPPIISQARFVWNSHPSSLFILLAFYFVYQLLKKQNGKYVFLAAFFSGFIYNFELAIAIPMSVAFLTYYFVVFRLRFLKHYLWLFFGFLLAFSPMLIFELRHDFIALRGIINYLFHHQETSVTLKFMELITKDHFGVFLYNFYGTFPRQNIIPSVLIPLIMFPLALFYLKGEKNLVLKRFMVYLLILPLINFFVFSFLRNSVYVYYLIDLNFVYIFLFTYVILKTYIKKNYIFGTLLTVFLIILTVNALSVLIPTSIYDYSDYGGVAKNKGKIDAIDYIYKDANGKKFSLLIFTPPVYTYAYDYLLWWYGNKRYKYLPSQEKKGLFYLLIEPDNSKYWSYAGWMETVVKTGKILETKKLPSGFIVQKRLGED